MKLKFLLAAAILALGLAANNQPVAAGGVSEREALHLFGRIVDRVLDYKEARERRKAAERRYKRHQRYHRRYHYRKRRHERRYRRHRRYRDYHSYKYKRDYRGERYHGRPPARHRRGHDRRPQDYKVGKHCDCDPCEPRCFDEYEGRWR